MIYKPHPGVEPAAWLPESLNIIKECDINDVIAYADVTVAILSSTSYVALVQEKPVVVLGYTHLRGKGCCYEAFERDKIEPAINEALANGMTDEMKVNFTRHIAQMNKYYLFDNGLEREIRYGRRPEEFRIQDMLA